MSTETNKESLSDSKSEKKYPVKVSKKKGSIMEISGSLPFELVASKRVEAISAIGENIELPGFRKGHVPSKMVEQKVGEMAILEESADRALRFAIPEILAAENIALLAMPSIRITKLAPGNPLEFVLEVPVQPELKLPDYKKTSRDALKKRKDSCEVTDAEFDKTVTDVQKTIAEWKRRKNGTVETSKENVESSNEQIAHVHTKDCGHDHSENPNTESAEKTEKEVLQPLTDEDVKLVGDYKDVADFKEKLKLSLLSRKESEVREKRRAAIAEALVAATKVDVPEIMIDDEVEVMTERFRRDVEGMGMNFNQYLEHLKKSVDDIKKEWRSEAGKRVILELALRAIADTESLDAPKEDLERETKRYMASLKDADENRVRERVRELLRHEEVFKLLEQQS